MLEYLHGRLVQAIEDGIILSDACSIILRVTPVTVSRIVIVVAYLLPIVNSNKDEKCTVNLTYCDGICIYIYKKTQTDTHTHTQKKKKNPTKN